MALRINNRASVYVILGDGKTIACVARDTDRTKLVEMSPKAALLLRNGGSKIPGVAGSDKIVMFASSVDPDAAVKICRWIDRYDMTKPAASQTIKLRDINPNDSDYTFPELVKLYYTAYAFMIHPVHRGNELRDGIYEYIHMAPLTLDEFIMIHECLPFDTGMLKTAQHHCMWLKFTDNPPPDIDAIEKYAKENGYWKEMERAEEVLREQKARNEVKNARRLAAQNARRLAAQNARRLAAQDAARIRAHQQTHRSMGAP